MKKTILIVVGVIVIAFICFFVYTASTTRSHSPFEEVEYSAEDLNVKVTYCRPFKKGRLIFGPEDQGALVPFDQYWRLGANDASEITFSKDVDFAGKPVPAGSYRMYAVPGSSSWEVSLNSELGKFGFFEPDYSLDVAKVKVPAGSIPNEQEQFTIDFSNDSTAVYMAFKWDKTQVQIPIIAQ